jgi:coiled-coil domain-containing protein 130
LAIRLLPPSKEDSEQAASIKFANKFGLNQRTKRADIQAASIFSPEASKHSTNSSRSNPASVLRQKLDLLAKRRRVNAAGAKDILCSNVKPLVRGVVEREIRNVRPPVKVKQA